MILATLETKPLLGQRLDEVSPNVGTFSLVVHGNEDMLRTSIAPRSSVLSTVSTYLASAVKDTEVPINMWLVRFAPKAQKEFNLPELLDMETIDDIGNLLRQ